MSEVGRAGRRVVASYPRYADAQRAVDYLSDQGFPVERTAIVAEGLRLVEQVTGRLTYPRAALNGALTGAVTGALFGFLLGLLNLAAPVVSGVVLALYGLGLGALIGAVMGVVFYASSGGQRDFSSAAGMQADRYDVLADDEVAQQASDLLARMPRA